MKRRILLLVFALGFLALPIRAQVYQTQSFSDEVRTLLVRHAGNWESIPVINLHSDEAITISFDLIRLTPDRLTYRVVHCDADWRPSRLTESEYMTGLQYNMIDDYANSFNTLPDYVNYQLQIPNRNNGLLASGNYAVEVYSSESDYPVLYACFSVLDNRLPVAMKVSPITDKGVHTRYQAVSFEVAYGREVRTPAQDLKIVVRQNNRRDNQAADLRPMSLQQDKAIYDHTPALVFEGGNEYRVFEMTSTQYSGQNISHYEYHSPFYHAILNPDMVRTNRAYSFYNDINGRIFIRNQISDDADLESDYRIVHFFVPSETPLPEEVYILSEAFNNLLDKNSRMEYEPLAKGYTKTAFLKEGYYNYLYVTKKKGSEAGHTAWIEGNHYETENEYSVWVYMRPFGGRYDQLVGFQTLSFR